MTDDHSTLDPTSGPIDDELVSAVLDGEATPAERALVEGSVEGRARLAQFRAVAAAAETVAPLPPTVVDQLVGRALDAAAPVSAPAPVDLPRRRARRDGGELWRRWGTAVAAVAAVVIVVAGIVALGKTAGRSSSSDSASSAAEASGAVTSTIAGGDTSARAAAGIVPPDLGPLSDAQLVLDRYAVLVGIDPSIDHSFNTGPASGSGSSPAAESGSPTAAADAATPPTTTECPVPPVPVAPGEVWTVTATAQLPDGPVLVMANGLASPANRVLVVDAGSCAVLDERTL